MCPNEKEDDMCLRPNPFSTTKGKQKAQILPKKPSPSASACPAHYSQRRRNSFLQICLRERNSSLKTNQNEQHYIHTNLSHKGHSYILCICIISAPQGRGERFPSWILLQCSSQFRVMNRPLGA
ncbi:unnamed protein product [Lactuca saligna]|uniref:Uncharacterized protein n=1 Tax=Lactuca saligna TaxID=75948 RepID=A0AA35ZR90_LACSI|nr:unnamed protein product [Lactuca saligna]